MRLSRLAVGFVAALAGVTHAAAQPYPSRPVTMVVPFSAGGPTDTVARILAEPMSRSLGQTVVVEPVTGAAGTIGVGRVARAVPDGYTIGIGHWSTHVVNGAIYSLPYDLLRDLEPVALLPTNPLLIVSKTALPAKDLKELMAWLQGNQDKVSAGTAGVGSGSHITGVYFQQKTGLRFPFVPYRGTGPAMQDLVAGQIDLMFDQSTNSLPQVRNGKIRAYAVTADRRLPTAPDIPTVDEAGLPGFHVSIWHGLWAPKGTPKEIIARLSAAAMAALADPAVRQRLADLGQDIPPPERQTPEALAAHHKAEIEKWWPIIRAANVKAE